MGLPIAVSYSPPDPLAPRPTDNGAMFSERTLLAVSGELICSELLQFLIEESLELGVGVHEMRLAEGA